MREIPCIVAVGGMGKTKDFRYFRLQRLDYSPSLAGWHGFGPEIAGGVIYNYQDILVLIVRARGHRP